MPRPRRKPSALRRHVFRARDAIRDGLVTAEQLRGPAWQRLFRGVYADADLHADHGLKARAGGLAIPPGSAITGVSAAWLWGAHLASSDDPVDVVCSPGRRLGMTTGFRARTSPLPAADLDSLSGINLTTPLRTAWELALRLDVVEAVVYCDALASLGRFDDADLSTYVAARAGQYGCRAAGRVFGLVDGRAESPQETKLRLHLGFAGLPTPVPQHEIRLDGTFVARVDLAWPELRVAVEYDGFWHADATQLIRDRQRLNRLLAAGWYVHHVTAGDMRNVPATIEAIRQLLRRRRAP